MGRKKTKNERCTDKEMDWAVDTGVCPKFKYRAGNANFAPEDYEIAKDDYIPSNICLDCEGTY